MPNQLYQDLEKNRSNRNFMGQFQRFMRNFSGNPKQLVQSMISSGRMSQSQFEQYAQMATELRKMLK